MHAPRLALILAAGLGVLAAQKPETTVRDARNGVTMGLGPATVAQGGILAVVGSELAAAHTKPETTPLPVSLNDPAVEVLINDVAAPLFFVSPEQINAQVPWGTAIGSARVIVRRGGEQSIAMPMLVESAHPNLFTHEGSSSIIVQTVADAPTPPAGPAGDATPLALGGPSPVAAPARQVLDPSAEVTAGETLSVFAAGVGEDDAGSLDWRGRLAGRDHAERGPVGVSWRNSGFDRFDPAIHRIRGRLRAQIRCPGAHWQRRSLPLVLGRLRWRRRARNAVRTDRAIYRDSQRNGTSAADRHDGLEPVFRRRKRRAR